MLMCTAHRHKHTFIQYIFGYLFYLSSASNIGNHFDFRVSNHPTQSIFREGESRIRTSKYTHACAHARTDNQREREREREEEEEEEKKHFLIFLFSYQDCNYMAHI